MSRCAIAILVLLGLAPASRAASDFVLKDARRILFLGDSNTFAGQFIVYVDSYLATRFPDKQYELINLGLPSETVTGLTEKDHPFPRPNVHDRADKALAKIKPHVVVICYGMNDGIYSPFSEERFAKYKDGIQKLLDKVTAAGARPVLMTPAPFDPAPVRKNLLPLSAGEFSYRKPYENYDDVLQRYSAWLVTLRAKGIPVADPHTAMRRFLADERKQQPKFSFSGDGIHPSPAGHALVARELLVALKAPALSDEAALDATGKSDAMSPLTDIKVGKDLIRFTWTPRVPLPRDARWQAALVEKLRLTESVNRLRLRVVGLTADHELWEGKTKLASYSSRELADGVDLTRLPELSVNQRAAELGKLMIQRHQLLDLAWLDFVGHTRPQTPKGLPLEEAQKKAAPLTERIRELAQPRPVALELRRLP